MTYTNAQYSIGRCLGTKRNREGIGTVERYRDNRAEKRSEKEIEEIYEIKAVCWFFIR